MEVLEKGGELSLCRHLETGRTLYILNQYLRTGPKGVWCEDSTDYRLAVRPGDTLSVVRRISDRALVLSREGTADFGEPSEVITREIMGRVFKVNVDIVDAQYDGMDYQAITAISLCNT